jgi:tight adherence protein B
VSRLRLAVGAVAAALALPAVAWGAPGLEIRSLDVDAYPTVRLTVVAPQASAVDPVITENGRPVVGLVARNLGDTKSVALAIDTSRSMNGGALEDAIGAARSFLDLKGQRDRVSLVSFGSEATQVTGFSGATIDADVALRTLAIDDVQGTALYDAIVLAADALAGEETKGRVIVVLTDGRDVSSEATLAEAVRAARDAGAAVYPIAIESKQFSPEPLEILARQTGGTYYGVASSTTLGSVYRKVAAELRRTWLVEYATAARPGEQLTIAAAIRGAGDAEVTVSVPGDPATVNPEDPKPLPVIPPALYRSSWGWAVIAGIVGALVLAAAALTLASPKGRWLKSRLAPYLGDTGESRSTAARKSLAAREPLGALDGLFSATERSLGRLKLWARLERMLRQADLPLRTVEAAYIVVGAGLLAGLMAVVAGAPLVVALAAFVVGAAIPLLFFSVKAKRRLQAFDTQLPDLLLTVSSSLKAGHSFKQALQAVVDEGAEPASKEFGRALAEARLGRPLEEALDDVVRRVGSQELDFVVTSVSVQSQVGGSLAGLFEMVADAVRQRQQFRRKVRGLTAMGRLSAYVLVALPIFLAIVLTVIDSEYMAPLWQSSTGHLLLLIGFSMMALGAVMLRRIVTIRG